MPPAKLEHAVLLALGLAAGCGDKSDDDDDGDDTGMGPCLDYPADDTGDTGPCLSPADDTGDTGPVDTGPCLDVAEITPKESGPDLPDDASPELTGFVGRVLERGVLPDDVAKLLRDKQKK